METMTDAMPASVAPSMCGICQLQTSQYNCPRCHISYCSLTCYRNKRHVNCSEAFYKDQVVQELRGEKCSENEKRRIIEVLERQYEEDFQDVSSLSERLEKIDLSNSQQMWDSLTHEEQEAFQKSLESDIDYVEVWQPWWTKENDSAVQEIATTDSLEEEQEPSEKPPISMLENIPLVKDLLGSKAPHPSVTWKILDVLLSYCFATRLYNGDHADICVEFAETILSLSSSLSSQQVLADLEYCVSNFLARVNNSPSLSKCIDPVNLTLHDMSLLLNPCSCCPVLALHALCDLQVTLKAVSQNHKKSLNGKSAKKETLLACRRLDFLLSFAKCYPHILIAQKCAVLDLRQHMLIENKELNEQREAIAHNMNNIKPKCLIEELDK